MLDDDVFVYYTSELYLPTKSISQQITSSIVANSLTYLFSNKFKQFVGKMEKGTGCLSTLHLFLMAVFAYEALVWSYTIN